MDGREALNFESSSSHPKKNKRKNPIGASSSFDIIFTHSLHIKKKHICYIYISERNARACEREREREILFSPFYSREEEKKERTTLLLFA